MKTVSAWKQWVIAAACVVGFANVGHAENVQWRYDYNAARREASEKGKPMILDFTTDNCFWCVKLESTTFREPIVARTMNERFIPLKVDAGQNPALTEALRIHSFPTTVLAGPDGKIINMLEGYMDASRFYDQLQRALTVVNNPEWMTRDYQEALKAIGTKEYTRAVALLKVITNDGQNRPIQVKARQSMQEVEQLAAARLAVARDFEGKGQTGDAMETLTDVLRAYNGTQAAVDAGQMLSTLTLKPEFKVQQRGRRARELLAQARDEYKNKQYLCCLERCESLASSYADLPEGLEANQLSEEIRSNPEWMRQACESLSDRLGVLYLSLADTWVKKGQPQQAMLCLERVIQTLPGSRQADIAQARLSQLRGQPMQQTNFRKP